MSENIKAGPATFKLFERMTGHFPAQLTVPLPETWPPWGPPCLFPHTSSGEVISTLGGGGVAPRMQTEFKFSICSPWLSLTLLLIFGTGLLRALRASQVFFMAETEPGSHPGRECILWGQAECMGGKWAPSPTAGVEPGPCKHCPPSDNLLWVVLLHRFP